MSLNYTTALEVLASLNYTADCGIAISWYGIQHPSFLQLGYLTANETINLQFIRSAWPQEYLSINDTDIIEFFDIISNSNVGNWVQSAFTSIELQCLGPALANTVTFEDLDFTANCSATAGFMMNTLCAINSPILVDWQVSKSDGYQWISTTPPSFSSAEGLNFLRNSWPYDSTNIENTTLVAWTQIYKGDIVSFYTSTQARNICQSCMLEFCTEADFPGNSDICGIGIVISYFVEAILLTIGVCIWILSLLETFQGTQHTEIKKAITTTHIVFVSTAMVFYFTVSLAETFTLPNLSTYYQVLQSRHVLLLAWVSVVGALLMKQHKSIEWQDKLFAGILLVLTFIFTGAFIRLSDSRASEEYGDYFCVQDLQHNALEKADSWVYLLPTLVLLLSVVLFSHIILRNCSFSTHGVLKLVISTILSSHDISRLRRIRKLGRTVAQWLFGAFLFGATVGTWLTLYHLWTLRETMKQFAGPSWGEDVWGFGQIISVLLWLPIISQFSVIIFQEILRRRENNREVAEPQHRALLLPQIPPLNPILPS
ncbi:hypothetical protein G7Y89_g3180 [Cudoniella acicularis]|uniref:Uncharacterized protein n=1 Tax=Cudoniella acicularis TaxID=354080 RepID=A0A8H4RUW0_9HELO|nr:hypothetical protein G7Y89_g3180 [Cudoniella acicularis]